MRIAAAVTVVSCAIACASNPRADSVSRPAAACPSEMARVDAFCIDRWEASLVLVTPRGDEPFSPYETVNGKSVRAVSKPNVVPNGYVSHDDAKAACEASKKRLCTEAEWLRACKGPAHTTFPYGPQRKPGYCNGESVVSPLGYMPPSRQFPNMENMNNPKLNQLPGTLAKTGEYARCTNDFGVFDMVGNLHEWVDDIEFLGGYYRDTAINGDGCDYKTNAHEHWYHDYSTGFRCCASAR